MLKGLRGPKASVVELRSRRKPASRQPARTPGVVVEQQQRPKTDPDGGDGRFVRAFADALRDILRDERRHAA